MGLTLPSGGNKQEVEPRMDAPATDTAVGQNRQWLQIVHHHTRFFQTFALRSSRRQFARFNMATRHAIVAVHKAGTGTAHQQELELLG